MDFFLTRELILTTRKPAEKITVFQTFYNAYKNGAVTMEPGFVPRCFEAPSYAGLCRIAVSPAIPKRTKIAQREGRVLLLHATDLALDATYRFGGMRPKSTMTTG